MIPSVLVKGMISLGKEAWNNHVAGPINFDLAQQDYTEAKGLGLDPGIDSGNRKAIVSFLEGHDEQPRTFLPVFQINR